MQIDRRIALTLLAAGALNGGSFQPMAEEAAILEEPWSADGIVGTLARPAQKAANDRPARQPFALLLAGSGPSPRDGTFGTLRQIAKGLAAAGIGSLRYDKRGVGASAGLVVREDDLVFDNYVDDAVAAARNLAARDDVSSVVLIGHSEGALIATLAASRAPVEGIVLLAGIGRPLDAVIREQLLAMPLPPEHEPLRGEALQILSKLAHGERLATVPPGLAALFRPSVQPYLQSSLAIDPAAALARLSVATLIVWGARDIQVAQADFDLLVKVCPDARKQILSDANHAFKHAPPDLADRAAQIKSYDQAAPLVPELVPLLVDFVRSTSR